jgi:hypothetical protein
LKHLVFDHLPGLSWHHTPPGSGGCSQRRAGGGAAERQGLAGDAMLCRKCRDAEKMLETSGKKKEQLIKTLDSTDIQTASARKIMGIDEMKISK